MSFVSLCQFFFVFVLHSPSSLYMFEFFSFGTHYFTAFTATVQLALHFGLCAHGDGKGQYHGIMTIGMHISLSTSRKRVGHWNTDSKRGQGACGE